MLGRMGAHNVYVKDHELEKWIAEKLKDGKYRNYSHAVEVALKMLKAKEEITPPRPF